MHLKAEVLPQLEFQEIGKHYNTRKLKDCIHVVKVQDTQEE